MSDEAWSVVAAVAVVLAAGSLGALALKVVEWLDDRDSDKD